MFIALNDGMARPFRIEGYAIVSADGMIADSGGIMPDALKVDADQQSFAAGLDRVDVVVQGRNSHEGQPNSHLRRRLIATRKVAATAPDPENPRALLWNPAGISFEAACDALGLAGGTAGIIGGTEIFSLFLDIGYDVFHLSRASRIRLPGGVPVFSQVRYGRMPEDVLSQFGLEPGPMRVLDPTAGVTLVVWRRKPG
jgi:hypothetical protein